MYRKIVWCYVLVLTLLDISLNTKLTAQGKSHDVTVHDSLIEGISFQEWGKDGDGSGPGGGGPGAEALRLSPAALSFGRAALGAAHALTVTLTNLHNTTVHLASVAGTTPDFHASFFESKTLPPNANTSFSVVYLGRREGPVAAHLYIHTSLGVHKYPVSAEGIASEWGVWPLVGLRVPQNATLDPLLTLYNPTDKHIQVREVYSSGSWVGLQLPGGGGAAPREAWRVPPHSQRALVRLRLRLPPPDQAPDHLAPPHQPHQQAAQPRPLQAYIRIKGDMVGGGNGLVVGVEATPAPPGEYLLPPQLRLRQRGSRDPPHTWDISAGNSGSRAVRVEAGVWGARCGPRALPLPPPIAPIAHANGQALDLAAANGVKCDGAWVRASRAQLEPQQEPTPALRLTLDYARLWASHNPSGDGTGGGTDGNGGGTDGGSEEGLWCGGWVRLGASALPYSVRLLPGTLAILPSEIEVITANKEEATKEREVRVRNEFPIPIRISAVEYGPEVQNYFHTEELTPLVVGGGRSAAVARLRLRAGHARAALQSRLTLRTNVTAYSAPLLLHAGAFDLEWEWPNSEDGNLRVGGVGASCWQRIGVRVRNPTPRALCLADYHARLPNAQLIIEKECIEAGSWAMAWLTLVAPARAGALAGSVTVRSPHAATRAAVSLHVHAGRLRAHALTLAPAAPYAGSSAPLELESTMSLSMRVLNVTQPDPDPAVSFLATGPGWVSGGRQAVGEVHYAPERACAPLCYTGLDLDSPEGAAWLRRGSVAVAGGVAQGADGGEGGEGGEAAEGGGGEGAGHDALVAALRADVALLRARRLLFARAAASPANVSLHVHTNEVVGIPVSGTVRAHWPQLRTMATASASSPGPPAAVGSGGTAPASSSGPPVVVGSGAALLAGVGGALHVRLRLRNPARVPLVLQPVVTHHAPHSFTDILHSEEAEGIESFCGRGECVRAAGAFSVAGWRAVQGHVAPYSPADGQDSPAGRPDSPADRQDSPDSPERPLLLAPGAELDLTVAFAPPRPDPLAATLYLRNNLTIVEIIPLWGRGAYPSFELGGRRPGSSAPLLFEVSECGGGVVRRTVQVTNTGAVGVRLREWAVAGRACQARGFRLQPCAPLALAPNETRALRLAFAPDYTLARVAAALHVRTDLGTMEFALAAAAPARLLRACQAQAARPPFEPALRAAGSLLALLALALVLAAAAVDAERELRRARAARALQPPARAPLDLRAAAAPPAPPAAAARPPPRRRRAARRAPALDPLAERRAFERWRAEVLRRAADDDIDRSSEEADAEADSTPPSDPIKPASRSASPPTPDAARRSSDDDGPSLDSSVGSDSSRADERDNDDTDADADAEDRVADSVADQTRGVRVNAEARAEEATRARPRREASEPPRRYAHRGSSSSERRTEEPGRVRAPTARAHSRREGARRRRAGGGAGAAGSGPGATPPPRPAACAEPRAPPALRWGATWSSVVAAGTAQGTDGSSNGSPAPLPPIGSDVRRRAEERGERAGAAAGAGCAGADHSLFYFNGDQPAAAADGFWRPPPAAPPAYAPPVHDYLAEYENDNTTLSSGFGSVWTGAGGAWAWGGGVGLVRPPPGFNAPPPPPPRAYDPFRSLAAIWAPGALDWRPDPPPASPAAATHAAQPAHPAPAADERPNDE